MKLLQGMMKKEKLVVILLIGLLLLIAAFPIKEREEPEILPEEINTIEQAKEEKDWQQQMEEHLERVLEKVKGVGKTEVILTCEGTEKNWWKKMKKILFIQRMPKAIKFPILHHRNILR